MIIENGEKSDLAKKKMEFKLILDQEYLNYID